MRRSQGDPIGADCDPTASTDPCAGICVGYQNEPSVGSCSAYCSQALGTPGSCGSDPTPGSKQDAACLFECGSAAGGAYAASSAGAVPSVQRPAAAR